MALPSPVPPPVIRMRLLLSKSLRNIAAAPVHKSCHSEPGLSPVRNLLILSFRTGRKPGEEPACASIPAAERQITLRRKLHEIHSRHNETPEECSSAPSSATPSHDAAKIRPARLYARRPQGPADCAQARPHNSRDRTSRSTTRARYRRRCKVRTH